MANVDLILELYQELKQNKGSIDSHFQDIAAVMLPRRGGFNGEELEGNRLYDEIFDSTPQQAARALASAIGTTTRPDGESWFFVRSAEDELNEQDEAREWFEQAEIIMRQRAFEDPKSRFRQSMAEADIDLVTFGTAVIFAGERRDVGGMLFQSQHLKNTFVVTDENNNIDGIIRRWLPNCRQAYKFFGDRVGQGIKDLSERRQRSERVEYIHVVVPRTERKVGPLNTNMPYSSIWIEVPTRTVVSESGFEEFPYIVPRFDTTSGEDWGRGPGMVALPDSNMLQAMDETIIIGGQKAVEPPLMAPDDGSFNAANTFPGGISYYDAELAREMGRIPIAPLDMGARIDIGLDMQQDRRQQVERAFFKHVMNLPVDGPEMTATEVIKRDQEFMREMGGLFGRIESDYIAPIVERSFSVMLRAGAFPPLPEMIQGTDVTFEYESPLKKVRQQIEAASARNWKDDLALLAQMGKPEVLDLIDEDAYGRFQAQANSVPLSLIRNQEGVDQLRKQRAEAAAAQAKIQAAQAMAQAAESVTKAGKSDAEEEGIRTNTANQAA